MVIRMRQQCSNAYLMVPVRVNACKKMNEARHEFVRVPLVSTRTNIYSFCLSMVDGAKRAQEQYQTKWKNRKKKKHVENENDVSEYVLYAPMFMNK